ncbi:hypothetical protein ABT158_20300 [Nonomuraea sp. NPDC001636]|uniref:hypothetical protein n=1 Tax=Nonomuraea sp. NPDC001636 TaxID=3154391 RepID=UPI00331C37A2
MAGISAAEATARLEATPADDVDVDALCEGWYDVPDADRIVGITDVPGGCVITQPWGHAACTPGLCRRVSTDTVCYSMNSNPKGLFGHLARDGEVIAWEPVSAFMVPTDAPTEEILSAYLYRDRHPAYCCAGAGLRLTDARPITDPPGAWIRLPERDFWA